MSRPYEAILFDFDGVLVDSEPLHWACWSEVLKPFGIQLIWEDYAVRFNGVADFEMVKELSKSPEAKVPFETMWSRCGEKQEMFRRRMMEALPMPEANRAMLFGLKGIKLAVVSSSCRTEVEPPLIQAGVRELFDDVICREDVRLLKPNPEPYLTAAAKLGVDHPLVVEDSDVGEAAGRAAGFDVLRVRSASEVANAVRAAIGS